MVCIVSCSMQTKIKLSPGQTDRRVVASGRKLNLRRDLGGQTDFQVSTQAAKKRKKKTKHFKADYHLFHWLIIGYWTSLNLR